MQTLYATPYPLVNEVLSRLLGDLQTVLGEKLVGVYLVGSLITGDFDLDISDIDLVVAISTELDPTQFDALNAMHGSIAAAFPSWDNRIEIIYVSLHTLKTFKTKTNKIGVISPGEPFHIIDSDRDWLVNWYMVQEKGMVLFGVSPQPIIDPISQAEFIDTIKSHARGWRDWINFVDSRPYQAYAILTMCRALYTVTNGEQVSKRQAALWTANKIPEEAALIRDALAWRQAYRDENVDPAATLAETGRFVLAMINRIETVDTYSD